MADMDDMYSHHFNHYRKPVDDDFKYFKYNEHTMLDKAKNYIAAHMVHTILEIREHKP